MRKKILAVLGVIIILISSVPAICVFAAESNSSAAVTVQANKTTAHPGDEIVFSVVLQQIGAQNTFEATLDIPDGLTYVSGSLSTIDKSLLGWDDFGMNEEYMLFSGYGSSSFTGTGGIIVASFKCSIDSDSVGDYIVGLSDVVSDDESYNTKNPVVISAKITVTIPVTGVSFENDTFAIKTGKTFTLTPIFNPNTATNQSISWKSDNEEIATVSDGVVYGLKKGTAVITATAEDGGFVASCTVTVECSHTKITAHFAESSTCIKQGHEEYYTCDACGEVISGSDELLPFTSHTGGIATCTQKAVCSVCKSEYGSALGHSFTNYMSNNDATCLKNGTETAKCDRCSETNTVTDTGSKKSHSYTGTVRANNDGTHSFKCVNGCNAYGGTVNCSGGTATCTAKAVCSVCEAEYGKSNGHSFTNYVSNDDATCLADGTKTAKCDYCDVTDTITDTGSKRGHSFTKYMSDGNATCLADGTKTAKCDRCTETNTLTDTGSKKAHSYTGEVKANNNGTHSFKCVKGCNEYGAQADCSGGTATCTEKAKCSVCKAEYGAVLGHNFTGAVRANNDGTHSFKCINNCGEYGRTVNCYGGTATCTQKAVCAECKGEYGEKLSHSFTGTVKANNDGTHSFKCVNGCNEYGNAVNCSGGTATCLQKAVCSACKVEYGTKLSHSFTGSVKANNDGTHSFKCVNGCNEYGTPVNCSGGVATCTQKANCPYCKTEYGEALGHSFTNYVYNKDAKCGVDGTETAKCDRCTETDTRTAAGTALKHNYVAEQTSAPSCTASGLMTYTCSLCKDSYTEDIDALGHSYKTTTDKATLTKNGKTETKCTVCDKVSKATTIYYPKTFTLSATSFTYTGKEIKPTVTVKDSNGKVVSSSNYTVSYSGNVNAGTGKVTITFKGNYSGTKTVNFTITPKQVTGLKVSDEKTTSLKLTWSKTAGAKYYKVEQSTDGKKWKTVTTTDKTSYTVKSLKAGTKYQFRVTALDSTKKIAGKASSVLKTGTLTSAPSLTLKSTKSKTATVSWKKVTGASKYVVYKSTNGKKWTKVTTTTKTSYNLTKLTGGKKIYVKVTALNAYSKASAYSSTKNVTVKK